MIETEWALQLPDGTQSTYPVAIHPCDGERIILSLPGFNGHIDGYSQKYSKIAEFLVSRRVGAVVRAGNHPFDGLAYRQTCVAQAESMIDSAIEFADQICTSAKPEICLMGVSAGASAFAVATKRSELITRVLLIAPSANAGKELMRESLSKFPGKVFITSGEADHVVGSFPQQVAEWGTEAGPRSYVQIKQCDHQFRGAPNGRIMSQAPLWAFADLTPFPNPDAGIALYS